jgi:hypothetical protein
MILKVFRQIFPDIDSLCVKDCILYNFIAVDACFWDFTHSQIAEFIHIQPHSRKLQTLIVVTHHIHAVLPKLRSIGIVEVWEEDFPRPDTTHQIFSFVSTGLDEYIIL